MVDALAPVVTALKQRAEKGADWNEVMNALSESARQGMEATKQMAAKVGRARYQKEKGVGHVDPGSASVAIIFRTLQESLELSTTPIAPSSPSNQPLAASQVLPTGKSFPEEVLGVVSRAFSLVKRRDLFTPSA